MSRLLRERPGGGALDSDSGVLPLINVVFLLLIFFMISGQLAEQAPFAVEPPASAAEAEVAREELLVLLAADGRAAVAGETVAMEAVVGHVLAAMAKRRPAESDGAPPAGQKQAVRLRADAAVDAVVLIRLIEELRAAGVGSVTLMTAGRS